ncbi:MAG: chorismate mutase [Candidatus Methanomethylophilaceae archaeon]|nr:chorismate mutase [Candidatus Methanomethylophilaceae archaeon]
MAKTTIGYMGIPGSNSEDAAGNFASRMGWDDVELVPLVDSKGVIGALDSGGCMFGVVATANINAGPVGETAEALEGRDDIETVDELWLPIHHCVFTVPGCTGIRTVASHVQALLQTKGNLASLFPDAERLEVEDTAIAARYLSEGRLSPDTAVICRRNAGEMFGLELLHENIEDRSDNMTQFHLLRRR